MKINPNHAQLTKLVTARKGHGLKFGQGIWTADKFVENVNQCVGNGICQRYFGDVKTSLAALIKEAANTLTYTGDQLEIEKDCEDRRKLATSTSAIRKMLDGAELPKHAMLAFAHVLTTPREDRDGDVLETSGAVLDEKMPLLWQHVHALLIGKMVKIVEHNDQRLKLVSVLLDINDLTADACKYFEAEALRFSHGFRALDFTERNKEAAGLTGFRVKRFEIMEESAVSVPSNIEAEVELLSRGKLKSPLFIAHAKAMQKMLPKIHAGVSMQFGSFSDLQKAVDGGLVKLPQGSKITVEAGDARTDADAETESGERAGHDHHTKSAYGYCPHCGSKGVSRERCLDGNDTCENGHIYPSKSALEKEPEHKTGDCGCGGKCAKCGENAGSKTGEKAEMPREQFATREQAEARATELGCTGSHQILGAGGSVVHCPCSDPYAYSVYVPHPAAESVPAPAGSRGANPFAKEDPKQDGKEDPKDPKKKPPKKPPEDEGKDTTGVQKIYVDSGSLQGGYTYRRMKLNEDATKFLLASGIDLGRDDYAYVWEMFDGYGIICLSRSMIQSSPGDDGMRYFKADWTDEGGEPKWTGNVQEVQVSQSINVSEVGKAMIAMHKSIAVLSGQIKVGRALSQANQDKLEQVLDNLAEIVASDNKPLSALAERCQRMIEGVLSSAVPVLDEDPQPKSITTQDITVQEAGAIILASENPAYMNHLSKQISAALEANRRMLKAKEFRKLTGRK